jgi:endonuclease I
VVSIGTGLSFTDRSVIASTTYFYRIFSYAGTGTGINYRQTAPLEGNVTSAASMAGTYYSSVSNSSPDFVTQLKNRIRSPYTKVSYDLYDETMVSNFAFGYAPNGQKTVTCAYSGEVYTYTPPFAWYTVSPFSREHTWCVSWMPSGGGTSLNEYADQHHLFPVNQNSANGVRSNHPLGNVSTIISSYLQGKYGYDSAGNRVYEPRAIHKGDAARALLYMSVRYDGVNGFNWTFNQLNNTILPGLSEAPQNLATLISWHNQDPPDNYEIARNDYIWSQQQNRNPFIDNPIWVNNINFENLSWVGTTAMPEFNSSASLKNSTQDLGATFLMYPNPAAEQLSLGVEATEESNLQVHIYSMQGAMVHSSARNCHLGVNLWQEDISHLTAGVYQVLMQYGSRSEVMRLVVE